MLIAQQLQTLSPIYRAGIWKPRTSPHSFQGIGNEGLSWLRAVKERFGMRVATEVATPEQVHKALDAGVDYLWIGARTSANPIAVQEIVNQLDERCQGVMVKNPVNEDAELWIGNIARVQAKGIEVMAIHRGCNHQPCWKMAYTLRKHVPDVALLLDPSHMSGDSGKIESLMRIAEELEYDGMMVESHITPSRALSDSRQQITPHELTDMLLSVAGTEVEHTTPLELRWMRQMMDETDDRLWEIVRQRMELSHEIGGWKRAHNMAVLQPERKQAVIDRRLVWAEEHGVSPETVREVVEVIHRESVRVQETHLNSSSQGERD